MVIPHLNEPQKLFQTLRALDEQRSDGIPFEIIVVDNGSQNVPDAICRLLEGVRLVYQAIPGPGPARNLGVEHAKGRIIAFIDADCIAAAGWIKEIVKVFERYPDIGFLGGEIRVAKADPARANAVEAYETAYCYRNRLYVERHGYAATGNMAVRADVFRAVGPFGDINTMEDTEWGQRATSMGIRGAYAPDVIVTTPPCRDYAELRRRYDRHIAHEFARWPSGRAGMARWIVRAVAVAGSPLVEAVRLRNHTELATWRLRCLAWSVLARLRLYRAARMILIAVEDNATDVIGRWNRSDSPTGHDTAEATRKP